MSIPTYEELAEYYARTDARWLARVNAPSYAKIETALSCLPEDERNGARAILRELVDAGLSFAGYSDAEMVRRYRREMIWRVYDIEGADFGAQCRFLGIDESEARAIARRVYRENVANMGRECAREYAAGVSLYRLALAPVAQEAERIAVGEGALRLSRVQDRPYAQCHASFRKIE